MHNISYAFDEEEGILVSTIGDELFLSDIIQHYEKIGNNPGYPRDLKVLILGNDLQFNVSSQEIKTVKAAVKKALAKYNSWKEAIVVRNSYSTAIGLIFSKSTRLPGYRFEIFSTGKGAREWLLS